MHRRIRNGLPKMNGWIRIDLPKVHRWFRINPPQVFHQICTCLISTVEDFWCTIGTLQEKHKNVLFEIEYYILSLIKLCLPITSCKDRLKVKILFHHKYSPRCLFFYYGFCHLGQSWMNREKYISNFLLYYAVKVFTVTIIHIRIE